MFLEYVQYLVLINLKEDSVQHKAWGLGHVQGLFSLSQPVDGVLQRGLETCCQGNCLIQLCLESSEFNVNNKPINHHKITKG